MEVARKEDKKVIDYWYHKKQRQRVNTNNRYSIIEDRKKQANTLELLRALEDLVVELKDTAIYEEIKKEELENTNMDIIHSEVENLKEAYEMKISRLNRINKIHLEFLMSAFITIIISLIGLIVFSINGFYIIHPYIYILGVVMGFGWGATAITSIYFRGKR